MPRRQNRRPPVARVWPSRERIETRRTGEWNVRALTGSDKEYRCPGCHQPVRPGTGHLLVWPVQKALLSAEAIDERRHWHTPCWQRAV